MNKLSVEKFLNDVSIEHANAIKAFPPPNKNLAALVEEVGELATALIDNEPEQIYVEAVQVATMAMRVALEADPYLYANPK